VIALGWKKAESSPCLPTEWEQQSWFNQSANILRSPCTKEAVPQQRRQSCVWRTAI